MESIFEQALAKINLTLHIVGRRPDGYHLLEGYTVFANIFDEIFIEKSPLSQHLLSIKGPFASDLYQEDDHAENLVIQALRLFETVCPPNDYFHIELIKNLPVGAGLGGGSADAAAVLRGLNRYKGNPLSKEQLHSIAQKLGADVPMCLYQQPCWISGIGDIIEPFAQETEIPLVVINPFKPLLTKDVFRVWQELGQTFTSPPERSGKALTEILMQGNNDLEAAAIHLCPEITHILAALSAQTGCWLARISGSGATCFGLYKTHTQAQGAEENLRALFPNYWIMKGVA